MGSYNKSLKVTFDPPPTFAAVKVGGASSALSSDVISATPE